MRAVGALAGAATAPHTHTPLLCADVLPGEYANDECPQFEFLGNFPDVVDAPADASEVQGKGFNPWCYPELHAQLGKESV